MHKKSLIVLFSLLLLPSYLSSTPLLDEFNGIWKGSGAQFDNGTHWTIKISINDGRYLVRYPSLVCGGVLTLLSNSASKLEFHESIIYGLSDCIDNGKTVIKKTGENIAQYIWYDSDGVKGATGELVRKTED